MVPIDYLPAVYIKQGCPFCLKLLIFLSEAQLLSRVRLIEGATPEEDSKIAHELKAKTGQSSFPSAEVTPGNYLSGSDTLIEYFSALASVSAETLPVYQAYVNGVFAHMQKLYLENIELKKLLA